MTAADERLLRDSLRRVLASAADHDAASLALRDAGWDETAVAEGDRAWRALFEETATCLAPVHPLDLLLGPLLAADGAGLLYVTEATPARQRRDAQAGRAPFPRGVVRGSGIWPDHYLVLTVGHGQVGAAVADATDIAVEPAGGFDPDLGLCVAQLQAPPRPAPDGPAADPALLALALDRAQLMQSWALLALGTRMLQIARDYVATRHQFGRPVGSFQAVKHLLADCVVELESLRVVLGYAGDSLDPVAVGAARAIAGRAAHRVGRAAQQATGAMGFSWEFGLHRYVRRAHSYDLLLGPWQLHASNLGQLVLDGAQVPRLGEA